MPAHAKNSPAIRLHGCRQHNLQNLDLQIPLGKLTVVTGPSGSGKSSLAFHTLYAEGQRRYVETFSPYVRQFFDRLDKPDVDSIEGIPPAIAIEQKNHVRSTRSTVGTLTEINDYLKLLFARLATAYDPHTGEPIQPDSPQSAAAWAMANHPNRTVFITFPIPVPAGTNTTELFALLNQQGYLRILYQEQVVRTDEPPGTANRSGAEIAGGNFQTHSTVTIIQDRLTLTPQNHKRLLEALEAAFLLGKGHASIQPAASTKSPAPNPKSFSSTWTNPSTGFTLHAPTPPLFSFNSPLGACPMCRGFGRTIGIDLEKAVPDPSLSIAQGAIKPFQGERGDECQRDLIRCCKTRKLNIKTPWEDLSNDAKEWIYYGDRKSDDPSPKELDELWRAGNWYGVKGFFAWLETMAYKMHIRVFLSRYRSYTTCSACRGKRLQPEALCFKILGLTLPDLWSLPITELLPWCSKLISQIPNPHPDPTRDLVLTEITSRLSYLDDVGLGYLTLDRPTRTLSGGEVERVNLTTCLGAALTGTLFVLDEPTVGLHARDIQRLVSVMHNLRDKGNTLVVVEHDQSVMHAADHLVDLGPGAGQHGGQIIYQGPPGTASFQTRTSSKSTISNLKSPIPQGTLPWLTGQKSIPIPSRRRQPNKKFLAIRGASRHNLAKLDADLPLGLFLCLTGVSGSGKSTFAHDVVYLNLARQLGQDPNGDPAPLKELRGCQHLGGVALLDQNPVARTPRSTPAVFLGTFELIRRLFCETPSAIAANLKPGFFSFNSGDGRCDRCAGIGFEKVAMQFLSDLYVTCPDCNGRRYKSSTLEYTLDGLSIADVLNLTVAEVVAVFKRHAQLSKKAPRLITQILTSLQPLVEVGLDYLKLGQPLNSLSGGESQRLKLCQLLASSLPSKIQLPKLLILDEPTTGLHFSDIANLLGVFQKLVAAGHTLLVIEHNLDVIKSADWILDLGPEAGNHGGQLVAAGPPEAIAKLDSPTGRSLKEHLRPACDDQRASRPSASSAKSKTRNPQTTISLRGARHHNLKNISLNIPRDQFVVISGLSGSGKSTLAFDILFAEGQRRFLDSMSAYARQFAGQLEKPDIDQLVGLPPTVAIEQRVSQGGRKSTVATVTEIWNFIRLLYAKLGTLYCPKCQIPVAKQSLAAIENTLASHLENGPVSLLAPLIRGKKGFHTEIAEWALKQGFSRLLVDHQFTDTANFTRLERFKEHDIDVVVADFIRQSSTRKSSVRNLLSSIEIALAIGKGLIKLFTAEHTIILLSTKANCPCCNQSFEDLDPRLFSFNSPHGWCQQCRGHGRIPKHHHHLDTSRFDSVLEAELDAERTIERMADADLIACPACHSTRLNPIASAVRLHQSARASRLQPALAIADLSALSITAAANHFSKLSFTEPRQALIARDILPEILQRLAFLQEVGLGYLQLDRSGNTLSGGESQRIRLAAQLGSNLRGVLYVLDEPTIGLHPRDNVALLKTLLKLRDHGNSLIIVEHDEDTIAAADHLIDLGPGAGRFGGEVVYQGLPPAKPGNQLSIICERVKGGKKNIPITDHRLLITSSATSPTLRALAQPLIHPTRGARRTVPKNHPFLTITGCTANNLQNITAAIPLARLTVLTGISGSGKSSLMHQCLAVAATGAKRRWPTAIHDRRKNPKIAASFKSASGCQSLAACYEVDQSPIGKTSRSCPATYVKVFDHIRALFAQLPDARIRGFDASRFSFNTDGGRCPECQGNGRVKLEMLFLPTTWVHCESCNGQRYNPATLEVTFRNHHIGAVLAMTIDEAAAFFAAHPRIAKPLQLMADTGLGYLQLGQPSPTVSGGEAQRIKLVAELIKGRSIKSTIHNPQSAIRNLYLIEEPTVGLHLEDIKRLINILHRLVDEGHTVVVIEHHMAIAAEADWILDLGPEAGEGGGHIVAQGPPEKIITSKKSRTAPFLKVALDRFIHPP